MSESDLYSSAMDVRVGGPNRQAQSFARWSTSGIGGGGGNKMVVEQSSWRGVCHSMCPVRQPTCESRLNCLYADVVFYLFPQLMISRIS